KIVRGIRKNDIRPFGGLFQKFEHIGSKGPDWESQFPGRLGNELGTARKTFHCKDIPGPPGSKFKRDVPRSREQIEHLELLEIKSVPQNIEQAFLGHVRGGPYRKVLGCLQAFALVCTGNDSHQRALRIEKSKAPSSSSSTGKYGLLGTNTERCST